MPSLVEQPTEQPTDSKLQPNVLLVIADDLELAISDDAIDWIDDQVEPWFAWVAYSAPHSPFHLPPTELHYQALSGTAADIAATRRNYYLAAREAMDAEPGRIFASLSDEEKANTLIIYIGDNGTPGPVIDTSVYSRAQAKGSLYEGGITVPMIVSGAGVSRHGERETALLNSADIYPTIVEATGANANTNIDGISFHSLLSQLNVAGRDYNYSEFVDADVTGWTVRNSTYKLIEFADGSRELYNLEANPGEDQNLLDGAGTDHDLHRV